MTRRPLIDAHELDALLGHSDLLLVDCRFELMQPAAGRAAFDDVHIAGAVYADLDEDLSDRSITGRGRHPLPDAARFASTLSRLGYRPDQTVVAYDQDSGAYAARLWWMLRWIGHADVAVLNGGFAAAVAAGLPMASGEAAPAMSPVPTLHGDATMLVDFDELDEARRSASHLLLDARGAERWRGDVEPIDPVAGHIPGSVNRPFTMNLDASKRFRDAAELRMAYTSLLGDRTPDATIHQCGSGVTACHNLLAMEHAGLTGSRLFAPSWSGWISDPSRPVARG